MKKALLIFLALLFAVSLCACGIYKNNSYVEGDNVFTVDGVRVEFDTHSYDGKSYNDYYIVGKYKGKTVELPARPSPFKGYSVYDLCKKKDNAQYYKETLTDENGEPYEATFIDGGIELGLSNSDGVSFYVPIDEGSTYEAEESAGGITLLTPR